MHRDRTTTLWTLLALSLGIILWRAWVRAADPPGAVTAADAAWAAARVAASFLVLAALALAAWRSEGGTTVRLATGRDGRFRRLVALALAGTVVVGMSGAVSALAAAAGSFKDLRILHPLIAVVVSLVLLRLVSNLRQRLRRPGGQRQAAAVKPWANRLHALVLVQLALGTLNTVVTELVGIQLAHLLLADLVWIALVVTCAASLAGEESGTAARVPSSSDTGLKTRAKKGKPPDGDSSRS